MKIKSNFIYLITVIILILLLFTGYQLNKKSSASKKNEISNLTKQLISKTNQISKIQKNLLLQKKNINELINSKSINFQKIINEKKLDNLDGFKISKYRTNEILFSGNYSASGTAYIDFLNNDEELILTTVDGIFAHAKINNLKLYKNSLKHI